MEDLWAVDHFEEASNTLEEIGQYSKALRLLELALAVHASKSSDGKKEWQVAKHIACLCNCEALARMKRGDMEAAACMLERAWEVTGSIQADRTSRRAAVDTVRGITMNNKATLCRENGDFEGARAALEASLQLSRTPQAALNMCVVLSALDEHEEALRHARLALQLTKSILKKEKAKRTKRAVIERRRREVNQPGPRFPEEHFPAPLEVPPGPNDSHHRAQMAVAHHNIAVELEHLGQAAPALRHFTQAMELAIEVQDTAVAAGLVDATKAAFTSCKLKLEIQLAQKEELATLTPTLERSRRHGLDGRTRPASRPGSAVSRIENRGSPADRAGLGRPSSAKSAPGAVRHSGGGVRFSNASSSPGEPESLYRLNTTAGARPKSASARQTSGGRTLYTLDETRSHSALLRGNDTRASTPSRPQSATLRPQSATLRHDRPSPNGGAAARPKTAGAVRPASGQKRRKPHPARPASGGSAASRGSLGSRNSGTTWSRGSLGFGSTNDRFPGSSGGRSASKGSAAPRRPLEPVEGAARPPPYLKDKSGSPALMVGYVTLPGSQGVMQEEPPSSDEASSDEAASPKTPGVLGILKVLAGGEEEEPQDEPSSDNVTHAAAEATGGDDVLASLLAGAEGAVGAGGMLSLLTPREESSSVSSEVPLSPFEEEEPTASSGNRSITAPPVGSQEVDASLYANRHPPSTIPGYEASANAGSSGNSGQEARVSPVGVKDDALRLELEAIKAQARQAAREEAGA